jgi:hypothetical protein
VGDGRHLVRGLGAEGDERPRPRARRDGGPRIGVRPVKAKVLRS